MAGRQVQKRTNQIQLPSLKLLCSQSVSGGDREWRSGDRNAAVFVLGLLQYRPSAFSLTFWNRSHHSDKTPPFIYRKHTDWDSPSPPMRYTCQMSSPTSTMFSVQHQSSEPIFLMPSPPHSIISLSYYPLFEQCTGGSMSDYGFSMANNKVSLSELQRNITSAAPAEVREKWGGPQSLRLNYKVLKNALGSMQRKLGRMAHQNQQSCGFVLSARLDSGGKWVDE